MYELSPYHMLLAAFGIVVFLAYWFPRLISRNEPPASALLIGLGYLACHSASNRPPLSARKRDPLGVALID